MKIVCPCCSHIFPHDTLEERFWNQVYKSNSGCWIWQGNMRRGYGAIADNGKNILTHRYSYELVNGPIPEGMLVCHKCDNPSCCNPEHLFIGTYQDNVDDKVSKGRQLKGERTRLAKLTEEQVLSIREERIQGALIHELASKYGTTESTISSVCTGDSWKHLPVLAPRTIQRRLTSEQVRSIRGEYELGGISMLQLAKKYGSSLGTVHGIIHRTKYKNVT